MKDLQLQCIENIGSLKIENFDVLKNILSDNLKRYENVVYTEEMLKLAKTDKKDLSHLKKELESRRKTIKKDWMAPYLEYEAQIKELIEMIDKPLNEIKEFIDESSNAEKEQKRIQIENYIEKSSGILGNFAKQVIDSPAFFKKEWLNKSTSEKKWKEDVLCQINQCSKDIQSIQAMDENQRPIMMNQYLKTLCTDDLKGLKQELDEISNFSKEYEYHEIDSEDKREGYKVVRLCGNVDKINQAMEFLSLLGLDIEEIEDGMPQDMKELKVPNFDSFVAFDIETSGTFGISNGDGPAEITEIGAVKVENGIITDRFSQLINPKRKIVPRISKLTHITDEMVANEPYIDEVIRNFKEFTDGYVLVGHNIKYSDLNYIQRDAAKYGVVLENEFFDTYLYAKTLKEKYGWECVKLEYLSKQFELKQAEAHRAWCDAEANVGVYFKLKELD